jgi:tyrosine-protein kinase Etk/Wzc
MADNWTDTRREEPSGLSGNEESRLDFLDLLAVIAKHKRTVVGVPMLTAIVSIILALLLPKTYLGEARVFPVQQNQSMALSLLSQVGGGALAGVAGSAVGLRSTADLYVGILKSRTIADGVIEQFNLQDLYEQETLVDTRLILEDRTTISAGRDGIILIEVEDKDPKRAADMANAYVQKLEEINQNLAISEAAVRRSFFERQLKQARDNLADSEVQLRTAQEKTGVLKLDEQGRAIIEAVAVLRAQIAVKDVQLASMRSFATDSNPDFRRAREELSELKTQLGRMESADLSKHPNVFIPTGKVPEVGMEYVRRLRDVKYHEALFELLAKQFELAKLDEAKDAVVIQVVDKAIPPDKKHKPRRARLVIGLTFLATVLVIVFVFLREGFGRMLADPIKGPRLRQLAGRFFYIR